jgi:hypothetical protein
MRKPNLRSFIYAAGLIALGSAQVLPQQMPQSAGAAGHTLRQPFDIEVSGVFRDMMLKGDFTPKVKLDAAMAKHPTTGVGAVVEARGEISIYDGKLIVSYGKPGGAIEATSDQAALLAIGSASEWQSVPVEHDVAPEQIETYIAAIARQRGLDPDKSFPFQMRGSIGPYVVHVNAAPIDGPHGMGLPMAITVERRGDQIEGFVAGFYVSPDLMGVATHGGEHTHAHWDSPDLASTAHLDRWGAKTGSVFLLPKNP